MVNRKLLVGTVGVPGNESGAQLVRSARDICYGGWGRNVQLVFQKLGRDIPQDTMGNLLGIFEELQQLVNVCAFHSWNGTGRRRHISYFCLGDVPAQPCVEIVASHTSTNIGLRKGNECLFFMLGYQLGD